MKLKDDFYENGFVIVKKLIPNILIDNILQSLEEFKKENRYYFTQSMHNWVRSNNLTEEGYLIESIQTPTKQFIGKLNNHIKDLITCKEISEKLHEISDYKYFINWQNMLFDKSTGTTDHSDTWYLDTIPKGKMIASWIALEDINKDSGRFFVCPKSHTFDIHKTYEQVCESDHYEYAQFVLKFVEKENIKRYAPALKKGDVLFWHPFTIHGSFNQKDSVYSRKSITAHYHPVGMGRKNADSPKDILNCIKKMKKSKNPFIYFDNIDPPDFQLKYILFPKYILKKLIPSRKKFNYEMSRNFFNSKRE
tara:strand:- start:844 stop:1764 length:921 start_codon:yes stop_codon:yes gene_type:complete